MGSGYNGTDFQGIDVWGDSMKKQIFFGFLFLAFVLGVPFWFFSNVSHEILLGLFVGLTPSVILWYSQKNKEEKEHKNWLLRNKEAFLIDFMDIFISLSQDKTSNAKQKEEIVLKRMHHIQLALLVWGSSAMFRAYEELLKATGEDFASKTRSGERFFRIIRNELGHDDSALAPGAVWAHLLKSEDKQQALDACKGEIYEWDVKKTNKNEEKNANS